MPLIQRMTLQKRRGAKVKYLTFLGINFPAIRQLKTVKDKTKVFIYTSFKNVIFSPPYEINIFFFKHINIESRLTRKKVFFG